MLEQGISLVATRCAICGTEGNSATVYPANFDAGAFTPEIFSARRNPDRIHYRLVSCLTCGLFRSDPVASDDVLSDLYARSEFHYGEETTSLSSTTRTRVRLLGRAPTASQRSSNALTAGSWLAARSWVTKMS